MKLDRETKGKIGIWLIIASVLVSNLLALRVEIYMYRHYGYHYPATDFVSLHEKRMSTLKGIMPGRGIVGYISDKKLGREFFLTQYALTPLIVLNKPTYPLVIGDFYTSVNVNEIARSNKLEPMKELSNGVILFESERAQ